MREILRLIINLVPSNELQEAIPADTGTLPYFGQWRGLELMSDEIFSWCSEDMRCAFYVFQMPEVWRPYTS